MGERLTAEDTRELAREAVAAGVAKSRIRKCFCHDTLDQWLAGAVCMESASGAMLRRLMVEARQR